MPEIPSRLRRYLAARGVSLANDDPGRLRLECDSCGEEWAPMAARGGRFHRGALCCPNGCGGDRQRAA